MNARRTTRLGSVAAVTALAISPLVGLATAPAQAAPAPTPTHGLDFDYFDEAYDDLGPDSVFETVTLERFKYILREKPGNFAFFIGDPNDPNAQATIGHINDVAKSLNIPKIYNFTPKIDGGKWNLWNWNDLESVVGGNALAYWKNEGPLTANNNVVQGNPLSYYSTHTEDYLNDDTTPEFVREAGVIEGPYLFVYNKDHQIPVEGTPTDDHIRDSLSERKTAADLDTPGEVSAFKEDVADVLDVVPANEYATNTAFEFWKDTANRRHNATYADANLYGGDIIEDSDNTDGWRVQPITYPEWIALLQHEGDIPFLFGGTWCHNTRAIVKDVNKYAQQYGVKTVYQFDYSLFSSSNGPGNYDHSRSSGTNITVGTDAEKRMLYPSHVYGQTVDTYLTNAIAEYGKLGQVGTPPNTPHYYYPNGDLTKAPKDTVRIQVGHFLTYNKDHQDATGAPAPVVDQALRQKDDGGNTEYMTEWWFVKGKDLPASDASWRGSAQAGSNALANQRAFAKEGIADIEQVFRGFTDDVASTTTVTGVGSRVGKGSSVTLDVALDAPGYAPYLSANGAGSSDAASTLAAKPRGWVRLLDDENHEVARARVSRAGTAQFPLRAQTTVGAQSYTVEYLGRGELVQPSQRAVSFEVVPVTASTTTVDGPASTTYGAGGTFTATVTEGATGTVRLLGLPDPLETTVNAAKATFALPTTLPVGSYDVRVQYLGDGEYTGSESAVRTLTVGKAAATLAATAPAATYGSASTVSVTAAGVVGSAPTGAVTVSEGGTTLATGTLSGGTVRLPLPAALSVGQHALTVTYAGNGSYQGGTQAVSVTVSKGAAAAPTFKANGKIRAKKAGTATVTVPTSSGLATPGGKVKVTITQGKTKKTVTGTLGSSGTAKVKLPKLAKGSWKVTVAYLGDATYQPGTPKVFKLAVKK